MRFLRTIQNGVKRIFNMEHIKFIQREDDLVTLHMITGEEFQLNERDVLEIVWAENISAILGN